ncbi:MAG: DEAD/DEAH box helicase [Planctomycetota bacterium]
MQRRGWPTLVAGDHALLVAPTGSGKTLAAFLAGIDACMTADPAREPGVRVLYVSPLKALVYDVERNLRSPLNGIRRTAQRLALPDRVVEVSIRTGDTSPSERHRFLRQPAEILVTTPESLFLLLGSRARANLRTVTTVIVDEVHALANSKRGAHLALSLERLAALAYRDPQRIGLSATVRPLDEVSRYLGGSRPVTLIDASARPRLELTVSVPAADRSPASVPPIAAQVSATVDRQPHLASGTHPADQGLWAEIHPRVLDLVRAHRSTIVFVNSRGLCERLAGRLNELAGEELVRAHHGSVSREQRAEIEGRLVAGNLQGIVATSSLELGIDIGAVDQVILVESPGSVARGLQRVGRAGHQVGATSVGRMFPKFRGDLLECAVVASRMLAGEIESLHVPRNPLDVLAQQIVAICCERPHTATELAALCRRTHSFGTLTAALLESVLDMLSGRYPSTEFADLRPLLSWDRSSDQLRARRGATWLVRTNAGTIPDRGAYGVHLGSDGSRVGELDEEMVYETRVGENLTLGASTWRVLEITRDRVLVAPAPGEPGRLPFWKGDGPGRPLELGRALGAFTRELAAVPQRNAVAWIRERCPLDERAASELAAYVAEQRSHSEGAIPTDRCVVVERFRDELGDWRVCLLSPFGAPVHAPWAMAIRRLCSRRSGFEAEIVHNEDGIVLRLADSDTVPPLDLLIPDPDEVADLLTEQLPDSALFAGLFRENAARSLLIPRRRPGQRSPLWAQRLKAQALLATVRTYPNFPIVLETYRHVLQDLFDLDGFASVLRDIRAGRVEVREVETATASPFARSLVFAYVAAYLYELDAPAAERRAQALTLDRQLLNELLGETEVRELIDPRVLCELESELQHRSADRRARDADEIHDLLRRLGDLSAEEIAARCTAAVGAEGPDALAATGLRSLAAQGRATQVSIAGEPRWIAAEHAGLYRDALGVLPEATLPATFLEPVPMPWTEIARRFAKTRGPFPTRALAERYGMPAARFETSLQELERAGALVRGKLGPQSRELEWCDADVLRRLKRRSLAQLRRAVAPVAAKALGSFLPVWHGCGCPRGGIERVLEVVRQLEGVPLPWSELVEVILPSRVAGFRFDQLDRLAASGTVAWVGCGALTPRDGWIRLYLREHAQTRIAAPLTGPPDEPMQRAILDELRSVGASFLLEIQRGVERRLPGLDPTHFLRAVWDLVWDGRITNDTFEPLLSLARVARSSRAGWSSGTAGLGGRWWPVERLTAPEVTPTERAVALAQLLLARYGIVSREVAHCEEIPGGFTSVYRVLRAMEQAGKVRRGYFVDTLSASQFATLGAVDRLRSLNPEPNSNAPTPEEVVVLSALDPANPFGGILPWPDLVDPTRAPKPRRATGNTIVLVRGEPIVFSSARGRQLTTFVSSQPLDESLRLAFVALRQLPRVSRRGRLTIERVDGVPVRESAHCARLLECGFESTHRGFAATSR